MKKIIILSAFMAASLSNAQELKTYSGNFKGGEATYTYYENDDGRVFQGEFQWSKNDILATIEKRARIEIVGNFKNNKRDGLWVFTATDKENNVNVLKVNYVEGVREGKCEYEGGWYFHNPEKIMKYSTTNKNGIVDGPVRIEFPNTNTIITGEYTQGHRTGLWEKKYKNGSYYHIVCNGSTLGEYWSKDYQMVRDGNFFYDIEDGSKRGASEEDMLGDGSPTDARIYYNICREFEEYVRIREDHGIVKSK